MSCRTRKVKVICLCLILSLRTMKEIYLVKKNASTFTFIVFVVPVSVDQIYFPCYIFSPVFFNIVQETTRTLSVFVFPAIIRAPAATQQ